MRHVARREGGIPPTKHCGAYRREDDGSGGAGSGREAETPSTAPNSTRGAMRGHGRGRSGAEPAKMRRVAQDCDPKTYMYMSSGRMDARIGHFSWYPPTTEGRRPRSGCPSRGASTVAPTVAARCQANPTRTHSIITVRRKIYLSRRIRIEPMREAMFAMDMSRRSTTIASPAAP